MIRRLFLTAIALLAILGLSGDGHDTIPYYIQLIQTGDDPLPPTSIAKPAGAKLVTALHSRMKWKHIWQLTQKQVVLGRGHAAKLSLGDGYEVEVERAHGLRKVSVFHHGIMENRAISPIGDAMTLIGEAEEPDRAVFVIVRRDPPGT